jgi:TolB-like protein
MVERNSGVPEESRIDFRIGVHLGDVVEEEDGDLMGDGVNIAARLEGVAKPGAICLSEDAYRQVKSRLDMNVSDLGPQTLKNIAEPVRVYSVEVGKPAQAKPTPPVEEKSAPPHLSIVVLPFSNIGGDPDREYFADGVTESLTTDLSRMRGAFVIARNTAFTYKGKTVDVKAVGRELNVRYVLEGSVQRRSDRLRVNVQLIDAANGSHLWAERFDKPAADFFDMQDEIVARLANQLSTEIAFAEARRSERSANPDALDLFFQGLAWLNRGPTSENLSQARGFFERARAVDPGNVDALVCIAAVDFLTATYLLSDDKAARLAASEAGLIKALSIAPDHAFGHLCLGTVLGWTKRAEQGIAECERALAIDRNLAFAHALIGMRKAYLGRPEDTEAHVREALRLSPRDTTAHYWLMFVGVAKIYLGRHEEAVDWLGRSIQANRNNPLSHVFLAAALAIQGSLEAARAAAGSALALNPRFTIDGLGGFLVFFYDTPINNAGRERIVEGLRKAGLPEEQAKTS